MHDRHRTRQERLFEQLPAEVDTTFVAPSSTLRYLSGLNIHQSERPSVLFFFRSGEPAMVLPRLETDRARDVLGDDITFYAYDDTTNPLNAARGGLADLRADRDLDGPLAAEYRSTRLLEYGLVADIADWRNMYDLEDAAMTLRAKKDDAEVVAIREAVQITDDIVEAVFENVTAGVRESDIEREIRERVFDSEADGYGPCTVTSGPRTALPHTSTGSREVREGDLVMVDMGVIYDGYYSDLTRTVAIADPGDDLREIYDVVQRAARVAREAATPGTEYQELDYTAREIIEDAGYGEQFTHRVGHGLGLEGHEPPYLVAGNDATIEPGNAFTIEPGVYVDGLGGVRIEDDVIVTKNGPEVLTDTPRKLRVL